MALIRCALDGGGPGQGYLCSGDQILCKIALQEWENRCDSQRRDARLAVDSSLDTGIVSYNGDHWLPGDAPVSLDTSKVVLPGGTLFPEFNLEGQLMKIDARVEDLISVIRTIIIAAFMILAAFIAGGRP